MLKRVLSICSIFILSASLHAQNMHIQDGWSLLGAEENLDISKFDGKCVDFIWRYNRTSIDANKWELHIANNQSYNYNGNYISYLKKGKGFWIKAHETCDINTTSLTNVANFGTLVNNKNFLESIGGEDAQSLALPYNADGTMGMQNTTNSGISLKSIVGGKKVQLLFTPISGAKFGLLTPYTIYVGLADKGLAQLKYITSYSGKEFYIQFEGVVYSGVFPSNDSINGNSSTPLNISQNKI